MSIFLFDYCVLFFINQHSLDFTLAGLSTSARETAIARKPFVERSRDRKEGIALLRIDNFFIKSS